jgi:glycerol-3-phosphate dehydrogenase
MYLCELANRYFRQAVSPADVVWTYSGVRPLVEDAANDPSAVTRDYHFDLDSDGAPLLSVFGGKITTFRKLAEQAVDRLAPWLRPNRGPWTASACLPGGDVFGEQASNRSVLEFDRFVEQMQQTYAWLPADLVARYTHAYGTRVHRLLGACKGVGDFGEELAPGLFEAEAKYWMQYEWALAADDMLWRRSKLGLHLPAETAAVLNAWIAQQRAKS